MSHVEAFLNPEALEKTASTLLDRGKWTRDRLLRHQQEQLQRLLHTAVKSSAWYSRTLGGLVRDGRPFGEFPVLTKSLLMEHFDEIATDPRVSRAAVEDHLAGPRAGERFLGQYCVFPTGGTSGLRAVIVNDELTWNNQIANAIRFLREAGLKDDSKVIAIGSNSALHVSGRAYAEFRRWRPGAPALDVLMPIAEITAGLDDYQPDVIITYPSFIRVLATEQLAGRLHIRPAVLGAVAESLSDDVRSLARSVWGVNILNRYNATEIGAAGSECLHASGIHLPEDLVLFESVDEENRPVPDGETGRKLLITTLYNYVQPLIRYEITDLLALTTEPCGCGLPYARICGLTGRQEELLKLPGADGRIHELPAIKIVGPLAKVPFIKQFQIALRGSDIEARLVVTEEGREEEVRARAFAELSSRLASQGIAVRLTVTILGEIPRQGKRCKDQARLQGMKAPQTASPQRRSRYILAPWQGIRKKRARFPPLGSPSSAGAILISGFMRGSIWRSSITGSRLVRRCRRMRCQKPSG